MQKTFFFRSYHVGTERPRFRKGLDWAPRLVQCRQKWHQSYHTATSGFASLHWALNSWQLQKYLALCLCFRHASPLITRFTLKNSSYVVILASIQSKATTKLTHFSFWSVSTSHPPLLSTRIPHSSYASPATIPVIYPLHISLVTRQMRPNLMDPSLPSILQCHFSLSFINLSSDNSLCIHCCTGPGNRNGLWLTSHHCCVSVFVHVDQKLPGLEKVI